MYKEEIKEGMYAQDGREREHTVDRGNLLYPAEPGIPAQTRLCDSEGSGIAE
jgi:hypothetical protein